MGLFLIWTFAPIAIVILFSFNSGKSLQNFDGFSTQWYSDFFGDEQLRESLFASLEIALVTMVVATLLGSLLAFGLVRSRNRLSPVTNVMMLVPLVVPEIVAGVSALLLFTQIGMELSLTTIILAHITFSISYVTVIVRGRLAALNREVEEAAMDLGRDPDADAAAGRAAGALAGDPRRRAAHLRAQLRRLRALLLHDRRVAAAAAGADLLLDPLRRDPDHQRDRHADAVRLGDHDRRSRSRCRGCSGGAARRC